MPIDPFLIQRAASEFPIAGAPLLTAPRGQLLGGITTGTRPGLRARSAAHAAFRATQQHLDNITRASKYDPKDVAADLLDELREGVKSAVQQRTKAQFDAPVEGYLRVAERAHDEAQEAAAKYRPTFNPESTTQMIRTDQAWNNHIKPMLAAGKNWDEIIPTLDADGIVAAQRFAPGYESSLRDRFHQNEVPAVVAGIQRMSERQVIAIAPPEAREVLREAQDTAASLDYTRMLAGWVNDASSRDAVSYSIALTRKSFEDGFHQPVQTSDEALDAYTASLQAEPAAA